MLSSIFALIELVLRLFQLWDQFGVYMDEKRAADALARQQDRDKAVDNSTKADTDTDIWDSQDEIVKNQPKP